MSQLNTAQPEQSLSSPVQYWKQKEDRESPTWNGVRGCAPCPAVYTLLDDPHVEITEQWQYFIRAINYNMSAKHVAAVFGYQRAFCNGTGFGDPNKPKRNHLTGENAKAPNPTFDKVRTCARAVMTGSINGAKLLVKTLDGSKEPPLKLGKTYPKNAEEANFEDYLYSPRDNREFFFAANIVDKDGSLSPFPNGGVYDWLDNRPYVWMPHVSNHRFTPVSYDLNELEMISLGGPIPSPYT